MYWINAVEYYDRTVGGRLKGPWTKSQMKKFVNGIAKLDKMPTREEVIAIARKNPRIKKVWVMKIEGNKWRKVMDVITIE